jgi:hypothetical protein
MYKDKERQQNEEENWSRIELGITWIQAQSLRKHFRKYELRFWISQLDEAEWSVLHSGRLTPFPTGQDAVWALKPVLSFWEQKIYHSRESNTDSLIVQPVPYLWIMV